MKNIKLALLCLTLSNIVLLRPMEVGYEEEEYPDNYLELQPYQYNQTYITDENYDESEKYDSIDQENQESIDISSDLATQLALFSFPKIESKTETQNIENLFATLDHYEALLKSIDLIKKIHPEIDYLYQNSFRFFFFDLKKIPESTKELFIFIIKQITNIQDIKPLLKRAIDEGNDLITTILICSLDPNFSIVKFDYNFVELYLSIGSNGGQSEEVFPVFAKIPQKLWLPVLKLQLEIGYSLLPLFDLALNAFTMCDKDLIIFMIHNDLIFVEPLFKAVLFGDIEYLKQTQFDIDALHTNTGLSLLGFASLGGQTEIAEYLINNGANVENGDNLHVAALFGSLPIVELLVRNRADINKKCNLMPFKYRRPIDTALKGGNEEIIQLLLELELNSGIQPNEKEQQNTFNIALVYSDKDVLERLLRSYPECFSRLFLNNNVDYPLHFAAKNNYTELVSLLLNAGINVNLKNRNKQTALHVAATFGNHEVIKSLLEADARPELEDNKKLTALDYAILAFISAKTHEEKSNALKSFEYLNKILKETFNHVEIEDFPSNPALNKKRRLTSLTLRSSDFIKIKNQKTELTEELKAPEEVEPLKNLKIDESLFQ